MSGRVAVATYNTHAGVGLDRRRSLDRIAAVLAEIDADIVALQELDARGERGDMLAYLGGALRLHAVAGPTVRLADGHFGNGVLSRFPIVSANRIDLAVGRREPRGALDVVVDCHGHPLRVVATHLGLARRERAEQVERLLDAIGRGPSYPTVLLGDINEVRSRASSLAALDAVFGRTPAHATFPALLPLLALDRIWASAGQRMDGLRAHRSHLARVASDHLPLRADIHLEGTDVAAAA